MLRFAKNIIIDAPPLVFGLRHANPAASRQPVNFSLGRMSPRRLLCPTLRLSGLGFRLALLFRWGAEIHLAAVRATQDKDVVELLVVAVGPHLLGQRRIGAGPRQPIDGFH